ncbi:MAG: aminotransferase class I/II-fold pyridoxal phosphate-dependent enzyme [Kofleriaceae bacterium]|nr:aminotransferase class I/II-fold pyridoxal phosphate-dependent enzyme [Kofleriaceae bacterium]MBP6838840.1 aminotransferase class I/II-fold pyridoxal phosphate-dependent enzyme [Kofleriaceae bacterium]MBP9203961.1 aminotransferase class I/II-fold pyridoxal phosphate-dependent enzyme [Kofleriaceae bacterium]
MTAADDGLGPLAALVSPPLRGANAYHVPTPAGIDAKLDANELGIALPPELAAGLAGALAALPIHRYPDAQASALRARLAARHAVASDRLVLGNGSDELIALLVEAFAAPGPGQDQAGVAFPTPSFVYYRLACAARGVRAIELPLGPRWQLDPAMVAATVAATRPNLAFFAVPNNPTGTLWPLADVVALAAAHPELLVVADEAYQAYSGVTVLPEVVAGTAPPNLVVMRTLSKIGMAGLRVGYLVASPAIAAVLERVRPPYNLGSPAQAAACWMLDHAQPWIDARCAEIVAERARMITALRALPDLEVFDSAANLVLVRVGQAGDGRASAAWRALVAAGVLVRTFDRPGDPHAPLSGCLRITVGTTAETDRVVATLARFLRP